MKLRVVYDAALIVAASAFADPDAWEAWPDVPPVSDFPEQDCLGIIAAAPDFGGDVQLVLHREILAAVRASLTGDIGISEADADAFLISLIRMAAGAGLAPVRDIVPAAAFSGHHADVVGLAEGPHGGRLIVSADHQLLGQDALLRQRGITVLEPGSFARRVDMSRRAAGS